jgi:hypothetical protein
MKTKTTRRERERGEHGGAEARTRCTTTGEGYIVRSVFGLRGLRVTVFVFLERGQSNCFLED